MANHDLILPYSEELADWLRSQGAAAPAAREGNRWPTREEVLAAIEAQDLDVIDEGEDLLVVPRGEPPEALRPHLGQIDFGPHPWEQPDRPGRRGVVQYITRIHCPDWSRLGKEQTGLYATGNTPAALFLVWEMTKACGQLAFFPVSGDPPVVLEPGCDVGRLATLWLEACGHAEATAWFYERTGY